MTQQATRTERRHLGVPAELPVAGVVPSVVPMTPRGGVGPTRCETSANRARSRRDKFPRDESGNGNQELEVHK
jgi:hypothetical protein